MSSNKENITEIWTAKEERNEMIVFEVKDETTGQVRTEERYKAGLPLMFSAGGYPAQMGFILSETKLPWRFRKVGTNIYIDGPSIGVDDYHPIDKPNQDKGVG